METQEKLTDEEFVRQHWEAPFSLRDWDGWAIVLAEADGVSGRIGIFRQLSKDAALLKARAFTEARLEEIRQIDEELDFIESRLITANVKEMPIRGRILARERDALAALKRGMRQ
jgi:hypothetical protein